MSTPRIPQDDHTPSDAHPLPTDGAEQQVITVSGPEDAVALVHHTLGFLPEDSLVVMGLHAGRTGAHLRIDLSAGVDHPDRLAHWVGRHLLGPEVTPAPDGAVIFLFTDEEPAPPTWEDPALRPWAALHASLCSALRQDHCLQIVQTWWIGGGCIRDYDCLDPRCCPFPGIRLERAESSVVAAHMAVRGRVPRQPSQLVEDFLEPEVPPEGDHVAEVVLEAMDMSLSLADVPAVAQALLTWDEVIQEQALEGAVTDVAHLTDDGAAEGAVPSGASWTGRFCDRLAPLVAVLESPDLAEAVLALAADGPESVAVAVEALGLAEREGLWNGPEPEDAHGMWRSLARLWTDHLMDHGGPPCAEALVAPAPASDRVPDQPFEGDEAEVENLLRLHLRRYQQVLAGATGTRPRWASIDALASVLHRLQPFLGVQATSTSLAMMAWIEWTRGRGTVSGAFLDRSLRLVADHPLARRLAVGQKEPIICPWAMVKAHSWS